MEGNKLTKSQKVAFIKINSGRNIFLTGVAGTGKTFLLKKLEELTHKRVFLTASTGSATLQLGSNARTISSFLGLGMYNDKASFHCDYQLDNSILVIDEISMIGKDQWKYILKGIKKNSYNFRNVQIIISGDPAQMPPIYWDKPLKEEIEDFFSIELIEIVRQKDEKFISKLMDIRNNGVKNHLSWIYNHSGNSEKLGVVLVSTRTIMNYFNNKVPKGKIERVYNLTEDDPDRPYEKLELWEGMKVLITSNNFRRGYVNGDTGVIVGFEEIDDDEYCNNDSDIIVKLDRNGENVYVKEAIKDYKVYKSENGDIFEQTRNYSYAPLLPAYYLSVRRAQGATLTYGCIHNSILKADVPTQYTAFSRFESIENVYVDKLSLNNKKIINVI